MTKQEKEQKIFKQAFKEMVADGTLKELARLIKLKEKKNGASRPRKRVSRKDKS